MLNVKTFMAFLLGYVEMELGTYYSKWLKRQNRAYRPVLYLSAVEGEEILRRATLVSNTRDIFEPE